jgi:DNA invertase Pin-like site-specific DNA recombinase
VDTNDIAKAAGVYKGRVASIDADQVRKLKADGVGASEIAKALKIGRASVYRVLGAAAQREAQCRSLNVFD